MDYLDFLKTRYADDELAHKQGYKYIDRKWKNGKWVYTYKDSVTKGTNYGHWPKDSTVSRRDSSEYDIQKSYNTQNDNLKKSAAAKVAYENAVKAHNSGKASKEYLDEVESNTREREYYKDDLNAAKNNGIELRKINDRKRAAEAEIASARRHDAGRSPVKQAVDNASSVVKNTAQNVSSAVKNTAKTAVSSVKNTTAVKKAVSFVSNLFKKKK